MSIRYNHMLLLLLISSSFSHIYGMEFLDEHGQPTATPIILQGSVVSVRYPDGRMFREPVYQERIWNRTRYFVLTGQRNNKHFVHLVNPKLLVDCLSIPDRHFNER